jgi:thioredoxin 2
MHLVCPGCGATNRIPDERLNDGPKCGRCGGPVLNSEPVALTDASFAKFITANDLPVVVDFWADWCGPCKMMAPHFAAAAKQVKDVRFAKLDTEAAQMTAARYGIRSIPTLILFRKGSEIARMSGATGVSELIRWLREKTG